MPSVTQHSAQPGPGHSTSDMTAGPAPTLPPWLQSRSINSSQRQPSTAGLLTLKFKQETESSENAFRPCPAEGEGGHEQGLLRGDCPTWRQVSGARGSERLSRVPLLPHPHVCLSCLQRASPQGTDTKGGHRGQARAHCPRISNSAVQWEAWPPKSCVTLPGFFLSLGL